MNCVFIYGLPSSLQFDFTRCGGMLFVTLIIFLVFGIFAGIYVVYVDNVECLELVAYRTICDLFVGSDTLPCLCRDRSIDILAGKSAPCDHHKMR